MSAFLPDGDRNRDIDDAFPVYVLQALMDSMIIRVPDQSLLTLVPFLLKLFNGNLNNERERHQGSVLI